MKAAFPGSLHHFALLKNLLFLSKFRLNIVDGISNSGDAGGILIRDLDTEFLLEFHEKFDGIEGIGTEVVGEVRGLSDLRLFNAELVNDDGFHLFYYVFPNK